MIFCLPPVLEQNVTMHRMQWYGVFYLFVAGKLYFDNKGKKKADLRMILILCFSLSLLTIWRREGIYLFVFGAFLLLSAYQVTNKKKLILLFLCVECLCHIPILANEKDYQLNDSHIVWLAFMVHMLDEPGFDREKYSKELEIVNQRISIEKVDALNGSDKKKNGFFETVWTVPDYEKGKYYIMQPDVSEDNVRQYENIVKKLIFKEPIVFLKSRINAFNVLACNNSYNLYIPLFISVVLIVYGIIKNNKLLIGLFLGILCHTILTTLFMPVSYFKYFYEMFLMAYVLGSIVLIESLENENLKNNAKTY